MEEQDEFFYEHLERLCKDPVKNVRSHLARRLSLTKCCLSSLQNIRNLLLNDDDKEVQKWIREYDLSMTIDADLQDNLLSPNLEMMSISNGQDQMEVDVILNEPML